MRNEWLLGAALIAGLINAPVGAAVPRDLVTAVVQSTGTGDAAGFDGAVEAVRQTAVAAQISGAIVALDVKAGDVVKAGQVLVRIDAHAADQTVAASEAQVQSARAALEVSTKEFERQKQLYERKYTSQAALERAEAQFKATQAQVAAQIAQAGAARAQSGFFVVKAPYGGVVAEVPVALGDMALPGRPLLALYDPSALRVTVAVPQTAVAALPAAPAIKVELPGFSGDRQWITPSRVELLPTVDPGTHTVQVRLDLPASIQGVKPGTFARAWLPGQRVAPRFFVPATAVVRRAEMTGLYVIDPEGRPILRQVRLGRAGNDTVEILSGAAAGERVALDPQAAARLR
jgi:multidrug efflux system membrane fusion protein